MKITRIHYFTRKERILWGSSMGVILLAFILFRGDSILTLLASLIGVTSLIFAAKGNPIGQLLIIVFSLIYGVISYSYAYYGEMITYLGMTAPMAFLSLISWLKNPYNGNRAEVRVNRLDRKEIMVMLVLTAFVTTVFYFILAAFHTANLLPSTLSVTTSFAAVYLTFRRSAFYAVAYAVNDLVLVILWGMASRENVTYVSMVVCFAVFFLNDMYGFVNWRRMHKRQLLGAGQGGEYEKR